MRSVRSWRRLAERADRVFGEVARGAERGELRFGLSDPALRRRTRRVGQLLHLAERAGDIVMRGFGFGAREDRGRFVAYRLVHRADAHQPLSILLQAIENA